MSRITGEGVRVLVVVGVLLLTADKTRSKVLWFIVNFGVFCTSLENA